MGERQRKRGGGEPRGEVEGERRERGATGREEVHGKYVEFLARIFLVLYIFEISLFIVFSQWLPSPVLSVGGLCIVVIRRMSIRGFGRRLICW